MLVSSVVATTAKLMILSLDSRPRVGEQGFSRESSPSPCESTFLVELGSSGGGAVSWRLPGLFLQPCWHTLDTKRAISAVWGAARGPLFAVTLHPPRPSPDPGPHAPAVCLYGRDPPAPRVNWDRAVCPAVSG